MQPSNKKNILPKEYCTGCSACMAVCPKHCITMTSDRKGFLRPVINLASCISCKSCLRVCQAENEIRKNTLPTVVLAARIKDKEVLVDSSSGGIAWLLSKYIIQQGGAVYGAALDERMIVKHIRVESIADLYKIQGSKYVQSDISEIYPLVKEDLSAGRQIFFIGTPCQVAAIRTVFKDKNGKLLTCDLICHGVPSPRIFADHIKAIETFTKQKVRDYRFRDKTLGWNYNLNSIVYKNGSKSWHSYWAQCYKRLFLKNLILRDCCYKCQYNSLSRIGDITLGDYWGIEHVLDIFTDNQGVSVVFANTPNGATLIDMVNEYGIWIKTGLSDALQGQLIMTCERTAQVDAFWSMYEKTSYEETCYKFAGQYTFLTIRNYIKDLLVKYNLIHV